MAPDAHVDAARRHARAPSGSPGGPATPTAASELDGVAGLLDTAEELWAQALAIEDVDEARPYSRAACRTLQIADSIVLDV